MIRLVFILLAVSVCSALPACAIDCCGKMMRHVMDGVLNQEEVAEAPVGGGVLDPVALDRNRSLDSLYVLDACPESIEELGAMGPPIVRTIEGREVRFCCESCVDLFEEDPDEGFQRIDKQIIREQRPLYPLESCVVSGKPLDEMGPPVEIVSGNRLVRLCCASCEDRFREDPDSYLAKLDEAVINSQSADYTLDSCPVSGEKLGSKGSPVDVVLAGRLVRLCCEDCVSRLKEEPATVLRKVDAAKSGT